jgi:XapX domain-containing protein
MRPFLISLAVGVAVGVFYGLIKVRSPAPPAIALVGLLGMLAGEQVAPIVRSCVAKWEARNGPAPVEHSARTQVAADQRPDDPQSE